MNGITRTLSASSSQGEKTGGYLQSPAPALARGLDRARSQSMQVGSQGLHRTGSGALRRQPSTRRRTSISESESYLQAKEFSVAEHLAQTPFLRSDDGWFCHNTFRLSLD